MDGLPKENVPFELQEYQMIRLGSPKRLLEKPQTFTEAGVANNDTLLITADSDTIMSQGLFDFEDLSLESQYESVQDIRASLRMPLKKASDYINYKKLINENEMFVPMESESQPSNESLLKNKASDAPFNFQALDLNFPSRERGSEHHQMPEKKSKPISKKKR
jgi:hypothetical protein